LDAQGDYREETDVRGEGDQVLLDIDLGQPARACDDSPGDESGEDGEQGSCREDRHDQHPGVPI
jgi:hypothetical protein